MRFSRLEVRELISGNQERVIGMFEGVDVIFNSRDVPDHAVARVGSEVVARASCYGDNPLTMYRDHLVLDYLTLVEPRTTEDGLGEWWLYQ